MKRAFVILLLMAFAAVAEEPLTNDDVLKLVGAGLTQDTIETKIFNSATAFRTDADSLIELTRLGVPDRVVRAMIARQGEQRSGYSAPDAGPAPMGDEPVTTEGRANTRYYEVSIHRTKSSRCDSGELKIDRNGIHARGCRPTDFDVYWNEINSVCYAYGSRGVVEFKTAKRGWRISTDNPARAKSIINLVAQMRPNLRRTAGCP